MPKEIDKELLSKVILYLKQVREKQSLTQEVVFYDTGIHIGRIESGKFDLTLTTLKKLCNYYDITMYSVFRKLEI